MSVRFNRLTEATLSIPEVVNFKTLSIMLEMDHSDCETFTVSRLDSKEFFFGSIEIFVLFPHVSHNEVFFT